VWAAYAWTGVAVLVGGLLLIGLLASARLRVRERAGTA
jgi:YNFM family putative membrane transporter